MPSSNKTPSLLLNSWVGSDIPKREDFNADNALLDQAIDELRRQLDAMETGSGGDSAALEAHIADESAHHAAPIIGSYSGNGNPFQGIVLGFRPRFGFVYAQDQPIMTLNAAGSAQFTHFAALTRLGSTLGIEATSTGFKAIQSGSANQSGQTSIGLNAGNQNYIYLMWR